MKTYYFYNYCILYQSLFNKKNYKYNIYRKCYYLKMNNLFDKDGTTIDIERIVENIQDKRMFQENEKMKKELENYRASTQQLTEENERYKRIISVLETDNRQTIIEFHQKIKLLEDENHNFSETVRTLRMEHINLEESVNELLSKLKTITFINDMSIVY